MTIIDRYIQNNQRRPAATVAAELGVSEAHVQCRRLMLFDYKTATYTFDAQEEIQALVSLIAERGSGWAVDIAFQRIRQLDKLAWL
ncbi:MAG: hypothetical protein ABIN91_11020 [Mucilaginibacter sp.]|uniref:hypothetical protein n=1 Tax=Mucilaginibacter sp. TaxID=1882438 RepID=UPI003264DE13